ncbi:DUF3800 domain-containing protein [Phototrophicus methaneseepsis]|uniref:DUF3800 domain-containing protein n=1 Tax=Phototrophicus methaneseepsis TaxID=2710758 RepID=A0A7S8E883_9CHLR|nr:DUF3800 domain-containing protein [Phototrophicus methaneseepsis]QPC82127.1 DUF3800 domain-containing protein [Phototrophicus methaneseepsis]
MSSFINLAPKLKINAYIDESGDEGFNFGIPKCMHSTEWLTFTAVCVKEIDEDKCMSVVDRIIKRGWIDCKNTPPTRLHWLQFEHSHKLMIADELAQQPFTFITVGIWKPKLWGQSSWNHEKLWHYVTLFLMERISWHIYAENASGTVTFSTRKNKYNQYLQNRIPDLMHRGPESIKPVFEKNAFRLVSNDQLKMLQIADIYAGIASNAIEPDNFGFCEGRYLKRVAHQLYTKYGKIFSYGLKLYPDQSLTKSPVGSYNFLLASGQNGNQVLSDSA